MTDWTDARLDAAFRSQYMAQPPNGLADRIHGELLLERPGRGPRRLPWQALGFAAAGALLGAILVGVSAGLLAPTATPRPAPSGAVSSPGASATPSTSSGAPTPRASATQTIAGVGVVSVEDAMAIRDSGSAEEIAVDGWYQSPVGALPCPITPTGFLGLEGTCVADFTWLMRDRESLMSNEPPPFDPTAPQGTPSEIMRSPNGPAFHPVFLTVTPPPLKPIGSEGLSSPTGVVFVGHFNDRRAVSCTADRIADCKGRFVVDAIAEVDGKAANLPEALDLTEPNAPFSFESLQQQHAITAFEAAHPSLLSTVRAPSDDALRIEPTIFKTNVNRPILHFLPGVWLAVGIEVDSTSGTPMAVTYIVDAVGQVWASGGTDPEFQFVFVGPTQTP